MLAMADVSGGLPHGAWVLVADGRSARLLRNEGPPAAPRLKTINIFTNADDRATREAGTNRPGRAVQSADGRRSAMEQTDWHTRAEEAFAREVAGAIDQLRASGSIPRLALVAAPGTLAVLRKTLSEQTRAVVFLEIDKDLTNHPIGEVERLLSAR
jgi:protein required for attachment to host cells